MRNSSFFKQFLLVVMILAFASAAFSAEVLYYVDSTTESPDLMALALEEEELNLDVTYAEDFNNLNSWIASQDWDLVVLAFQGGNAPSDLDGCSVDEYVNDGGRSIFCHWEVSSDDAEYYALFGAEVSGNYNSTEVTINSEGIDAGLAPSSFILQNPDWGTFSVGLSPLASEDIVAATFADGDALDDAAIIISNNGRTIINGFLNDTPPDDTFYVSEIKYLLSSITDEDNDATDTSGGSSGCNTAALVPSALLLIAPLFLLARRR